MLIVRIKVGSAEGRRIKLKSGELKNVAEQMGVVELGEDEVRKIRIPIDVQAGQQPYPAGSYVVSAGSYRVNNFGGLEVNPWELHLTPLAQVAELVRSSLKAA